MTNKNIILQWEKKNAYYKRNFHYNKKEGLPFRTLVNCPSVH